MNTVPLAAVRFLKNQSSLLRCHEVTGKTKSDSNKLTVSLATQGILKTEQ